MEANANIPASKAAMPLIEMESSGKRFSLFTRKLVERQGLIGKPLLSGHYSVSVEIVLIHLLTLFSNHPLAAFYLVLTFCSPD
jgi:hypothetical protein